jgi:hypothetical protein
VHGAAAEQVEVEVVDGLAAVGAGVEDEAVAVVEAVGAGELAGGKQEMAEEFVVRCSSAREGSDVLFGDKEDVRWGLRMDVREGEDGVVFVETLGGDDAGDDLAEEAGHRGPGSRV